MVSKLKPVVVLTLLTLCCPASARSGELPSNHLRRDMPARLVELTANVDVTNKTSTPITRYVFRVTAPPTLDSQLVKTSSSTAERTRRREHKNETDSYLEMEFPVPEKKSSKHRVTFSVLVMPVDYLQGKRSASEPDHKELDRYLQPSALIESDSPEVQKVSRSLFRRRQTPEATAKTAYEFPARVLRFKVQDGNLGARKALQTRVGDCTEFACLFAALCRTQQIPARRINVFNFGKNQSISAKQPNHHIAEIHLKDVGWMPVDPNLGGGRYDRDIGFGKLGNTIVILNREGSWVWSSWLPPNGFSKSLPKPRTSYGISWTGRIVAEGPVDSLFEQFQSIDSVDSN